MSSISATTPRPPAGTSWVDPQTGQPGRYQTPAEVASIVLAETRKLGKNTKLTWTVTTDPKTGAKRLPVSGPAKMIGDELCLALPYVLVDKRYYIQNAKIFAPNGEVISLDEVFEREGGAGCFLRVKAAYENFLALSSGLSDSVCRICRSYDASDHEDYLRHMLAEHPDHVSGMAKKVAADEAAAPDPSVYVCECCGKEWASPAAIRMHKFQQAKKTNSAA